MKQVWLVIILLLSQASVHAVTIINTTNKRLFIFPGLYQQPNIHGDEFDPPYYVVGTADSKHNILNEDLESAIITFANGPMATDGTVCVSASARRVFINLQPYHVIRYKENPDECEIVINETLVPSEGKISEEARIVTYEEYERHKEQQEDLSKNYKETRAACLNS